MEKKMIDAEKFYAHEVERCGGCAPLIGTCSMDNISLKEALDQMIKLSEAIEGDNDD